MRPRGTSPRFVGRMVELSLLGELVDEARAGTPVTVIICGEAGVGKSRLVAEVTTAAREQGTLTLTGSCSAVGRTSFAFAPFAEALELTRTGSQPTTAQHGLPHRSRTSPPTSSRSDHAPAVGGTRDVGDRLVEDSESGTADPCLVSEAT